MKYNITQEKKAAITIPFGGKLCPLLRSTRVSAGLRRRFVVDLLLRLRVRHPAPKVGSSLMC